jgi:hypothetical protein
MYSIERSVITNALTQESFMAKFLMIVTALLSFLNITPAHAANYSICSEAIALDEALIAPVEPIKSATVVSPEIMVVLVGGASEIGDTVVPVNKRYYNEELYDALLKDFVDYGAWIGVIEGLDGANDPALWMRVYAQTTSGCVISSVDNRVYSERANAPYVFAEAIGNWEHQHPEGILIRRNN